MTDIVQIELIHQIGTVMNAAPAIVAAWLAYKTLKKGEQIHDQGERNYSQMNGRMEEMLKLKGEAAEGVGQQKERDEQRQRDIATPEIKGTT